VEDPTRVFRAIRFEQRFGFRIGKLTAGLIENAVAMDFFKVLSGRRVFTELRQILQEDNPVPAIMRLNDFNLLKVIHASIQFDKHLIMMLNSTKKVLAWHDLLFLDESYMKWIVYFLILTNQCDRMRTEEICNRFELGPRDAKIFCRDHFEAAECLYWLERHLPVDNSILYQKLSGFKTELILYMMAATQKQAVKKAISHFFTRLRRVTISLKGRDLKKMGFAPGPVYRDALQATLDAKLNGQVKTRRDELDFARNYYHGLSVVEH
jgi:tRNA nucleotidyltransferase (CCA-adding enzyme)